MSLAEENFMGLHHHDLEGSCFGLAVAQELRRRHPYHTAKTVARNADVALKTAENILSGHLSARSMTRLLRAYGLPLLLEAGAALTGQTLRDIIIEQAAAARREQARAEELLREYTAVEGGLGADKALNSGERRTIS